MERKYVYDTNICEFRKIIVHSYVFQLLICLIVLVIFSVLPSFVLYLLSFSQLNGPIFPTRLLIFMSIVSGIFLTLLTVFSFCVMVKQKISVVFSANNLSLVTQSFLGKESVTIDYKDIKKLFVPLYANNILWKKFVGEYPLVCKNKKEVKNGQILKYSENVSRVVFWNKDINEIKEIIQYCKNKSQKKQ